MIKYLYLTLLVLLGLAGPVWAEQSSTEKISITNAWSRVAPPGARVLSGYVTVSNGGSDADMLLSVSSPIAKKTTLHTMSVEDGLAKMRPLPQGVPVNPGQSIMFEPGGMHLMFADPTSLPKLGDTFEATLFFKGAGEIKIEFKVLAAVPAVMSHDSMSQSP